MTNDTKSRLTEAERLELVVAVKKWLPASYGPLVTTLGEWAERVVAWHEETAILGHEKACECAGAALDAARRQQEAEAKLAALEQRIKDLIAAAEYRRKVFGLVHLHPSSITPGNLRALLDGES